MAAYGIAGDHIAAEVVDGELIIMNMAEGSYFSALGSGRHLWELLISGADEAVVYAAMARRAADPEAFLIAARAMTALLIGEGLIVAIPMALVKPEAELSNGLGETPILPPAIEVHRDMEDILMLDPIHDVGQAGWPVRPDGE